MPNNLSKETSPYLLQHKDNPVEWYSWNDESLKKANYESLISLAIKHSDGLILSSENVPPAVVEEVEKSKKPHLNFNDSKNEEVYIDFYSNKF